MWGIVRAPLAACGGICSCCPAMLAPCMLAPAMLALCAAVPVTLCCAAPAPAPLPLTGLAIEYDEYADAGPIADAAVPVQETAEGLRMQSRYQPFAMVTDAP